VLDNLLDEGDKDIKAAADVVRGSHTCRCRWLVFCSSLAWGAETLVLSCLVNRTIARGRPIARGSRFGCTVRLPLPQPLPAPVLARRRFVF
jgi:hypothetical protein